LQELEVYALRMLHLSTRIYRNSRTHTSIQQRIFGIVTKVVLKQVAHGSGLVWARRGPQIVHYLMPNEREWITILSCIDASGSNIFRGKRVMENYVEHCEDGASMAMQPEGWMIAFLFS
jgi:hypothetical protein